MTNTTQLYPTNPFTALIPKPQPANISIDFSYESKFVNVLDSRMHYVERGNGNPILFLHGNPTSSYLWRNIMPYLETQGRVIAVDNIGFGKSDKPDIDYTFTDHARYLEAFIDILDLQKITLITHEWGASLGLDYAARHENNIYGLALMEATLPHGSPFPKSEMLEELAPLFQCFRDPVEGPKYIIEENQFIETLLPAGVVRSLTEAEINIYRLPFTKPESRKPILVWPNQLPTSEEPTHMMKIMENYSKWLLKTDLPKLHIYGSPGIVNPPSLVDFLKKKLKNYETVYVGAVLHYLQEDHPEIIGRAIADWYRRLT